MVELGKINKARMMLSLFFKKDETIFESKFFTTFKSFINSVKNSYQSFILRHFHLKNVKIKI